MVTKPERRWFPIVLRELEVLRAFDVTPKMRRVVLGGDELGAFHRYGFDLPPFRTEAPDDHVKLFFTAPGESEPVLPHQEDGHLHWPHDGPRPIARDYTPRRFDPELGELELDFVLHEGGIAAGWAANAEPGDRIFLAGPKLSTVLPAPPEWYLLAGDETALPAIARTLAELPPGSRAKVIIEVAGPEEEQDLGTDVTWLHRDRGGQDLLERAIREIDWPSDDVYAWVAGETGTLRGIRDHLRKERGLPPERVCVTGYWKRGTSLMDAASRYPELLALSDLLTPHALRALVSLRVPELLAAGVRETGELARRCGADERVLRAVLEHLAGKDVVRRARPGEFVLTGLGELLLNDDMHEHLALDLSAAPRSLAFAGLAHTLRTGEPGYGTVFAGRDYRADMAEDTTAGLHYDRARADEAEQVLPFLLEARDWTGTRHVVDIGGGQGILSTGLLRRLPDARATLVDLPTVAARARSRVEGSGVEDRLDVLGQSLFEPLPRDGDVYLLAGVLSRWPDAECELILRRAAEAASPRARVLVVEELFDEATAEDHDFEEHLEALVTYGSGMRGEDEFRVLADSAGLRHVRTVPAGAHLSLVEFAPR